MSVLMYNGSTFSEAKSAINEISKGELKKCKKFLQTCKAVSVSEMPEVMSDTILIKWLESLPDFFALQVGLLCSELLHKVVLHYIATGIFLHFHYSQPQSFGGRRGGGGGRGL